MRHRTVALIIDELVVALGGEVRFSSWITREGGRIVWVASWRRDDLIGTGPWGAGYRRRWRRYRAWGEGSTMREALDALVVDIHARYPHLTSERDDAARGEQP